MSGQKRTTHDIPVEALLKVLADPCRRTVLSYLRTKDMNVATLEELATHVHAHVEEVTSPDHARIVLMHQHLPRLVDHRLIEYDHQSQTIQYWENTASDAILKVNTVGEQ